MNKPHYIKTIFQHLNDANTQQKTDQKCDNHAMKKIDELANKQRHLNKNEEVISYKHFFSINNFYGLPKVHKSKQINETN